MTQAKINSIRFVPGEYAYTNGHKGHERSHYNKKKGAYVTQRGFGWASEWTPSKITIDISTKSGYFEVWVDKFFRDNWGRLTEGRVQAILDSVPETVFVNKQISRTGYVYYTVDDSSLSDWLERAKAA